jgi:hypothetical protein
MSLRVDDASKCLDIPGAFSVVEYEGQPVGIAHVCPCGCGELSFCALLPFYKGTAPVWTMTGTLDAPTLEPSVQVRHPCKWHGYLQNGEWVKAKA